MFFKSNSINFYRFSWFLYYLFYLLIGFLFGSTLTFPGTLSVAIIVNALTLSKLLLCEDDKSSNDKSPPVIVDNHCLAMQVGQPDLMVYKSERTQLYNSQIVAYCYALCYIRHEHLTDLADEMW